MNSLSCICFYTRVCICKLTVVGGVFFGTFLALRYVLRNKNEDETCEELVALLTDVLNRELSGDGPEDVLSESRLEELRHALESQVITNSSSSSSYFSFLSVNITFL